MVLEHREDAVKCYHVLILQLATSLSRHPLSPPSCKRGASINLNSITSHMCTTCTCKEQTQSAEITRLANSSRWLSRLQHIPVLIQSKVCHARRKDAWANDVDHDVLWRQLRRRHLREMDTSRFCWSIYTINTLASNSPNPTTTPTRCRTYS